MNKLQFISISNFLLQCGDLEKFELSYQTFGQPLGMAPIVLVNHALTGNSNVTGENGWWNNLVGENKVIDLRKYSVIAFNIPGNGFDGKNANLIQNYKKVTTKDIAAIFWKGLEYLKINQLYAVIGGSLGGAIAWEMAYIKPKSIQYIIPIATNWKASDWIIGNVLVQDAILNNSINPIHDARLHAMLLYRTPQSLALKFEGKKQEKQDVFKVESWLLHHGEKLQQRFQLQAYKLMNHLLKTVGSFYSEIDWIDIVENSNIKICQIAINSDYFFTSDSNLDMHFLLSKHTNNITYNEINSIHGHDAFLIEYDKLNDILKPIFTTNN